MNDTVHILQNTEFMFSNFDESTYQARHMLEIRLNASKQVVDNLFHLHQIHRFICFLDTSAIHELIITNM